MRLFLRLRWAAQLLFKSTEYRKGFLVGTTKQVQQAESTNARLLTLCGDDRSSACAGSPTRGRSCGSRCPE
jgi:hypothetical protein